MNYRVWDGYVMSYRDTPTEGAICMMGTDILDSQGREIYEADVVTDGRLKGVVEYEENLERFSIRCANQLRPMFEGGDLTVLGNAFEDKELV